MNILFLLYLQDTCFPNIQVPVFKTGESKSHCCYVCQKFVQKIPRHMETAHSDVPEVARILSLPKNKKDEREHEMERLRLLGNFEHNLQVYCKKEGVYVTLRRSHQPKVAEDYLPCIHCYGFVETSELWRHVKKCKFNEAKDEDEEYSENTVHSQCRMLLEGANLYSASDFHDVMKDVVDKMHPGPIKDTVKQDKLILSLGKALYNQKGKSKKHYISQKMRQLARLVIEVKKKEYYQDKTLDDIICADMFDEVIEATQALSKPENKSTMNGVKMTKAPSIGLHLGHLLVKVSMIKRGMAIRMHDDTRKRDTMDFKELHESDWTEKISSPALQTLRENKFFRSENLPLTSDLKKVMNHSQQMITENYKALQQKASSSAWVGLEKALFVAISLFNKRRGGIMAALQTVCVTSRNRSSPNEEILESLSDLEKQLLKR